MTALLPQNLEFSPAPVGAWPGPSFQVVSLLEMLPFAAEVFQLECIELRNSINTLTQAVDERGLGAQTTNQDAETPLVIVRLLKPDCEKIDLQRASERLWSLGIRLTRVEHGSITEQLFGIICLDHPDKEQADVIAASKWFMKGRQAEKAGHLPLADDCYSRALDYSRLNPKIVIAITRVRTAQKSKS